MDILEISLITLVCASAVCIIVLTVFLAKLLFNANKLLIELNKAADTVNNELEPVVSDLKESVASIKSLINTADTRVKVINCAINGVVGATGILTGKLKGVASGLVEGFRAGLNLFKK